MPSSTQIFDRECMLNVGLPKPEPTDYLKHTIIVDGCPITGPEKFERLKQFLLTNFREYGDIIHSHFPTDEDGKTIGVIFITYDTAKAAKKAVTSANNKALDRSHTGKLSLASDYDKAVNCEQKLDMPKFEEYVDAGNLQSWLQNDLCRDQFATLSGEDNKGSIYWSTSMDPVLVHSRDSWGQLLRWSPRGTYIASRHTQGVLLWGGEEFVRIAKYPHPDVYSIDFSPKENYMVTWSLIHNANKPAESNRYYGDVIIWDIRKQMVAREFTMIIQSMPVFKFSYNDEYFACLREGAIYIYSTKDFKLLNKTAVKVAQTNIVDFSWSPSDNIIAYSVPEMSNTPARVVLIDIPNRSELCMKNLFSVIEINLIWQDHGDFLAIQVLRYAKKKSDNEKRTKYLGTFVNFEIVRMREKQYPVDLLEVKDSAVSSFQWEPAGSRFAYISHAVSVNKFSILIYQVTKSGKIKETANVDKLSSRITDLKWSPKGGILVATDFKSAEGPLDFIDANESQLLDKCEHPGVSEVHWDPTGRYLASCALSYHQKTDNGVKFWSSFGRSLHNMPVRELKQFIWRPRPPSLLSNEHINGIKKKMSSYSTKFEHEDAMLASKASRELLEKRKALMAQFNAWRQNLVKVSQSEKKERDSLRGNDDSMDDDMVEETIEVMLEKQEEVYQKNED